MEWLPIFIIRICIGIFFILSGSFKLFDSQEHAKLLKIMVSAHLANPEWISYLFPIIELVCGSLILIGLLTTISALIMFIIMITTLILTKIGSAAAHVHILFIANLFYLPEVLYTLIFFWLMFSGPGKVSFDHRIGKKKRMTND